MNTTATRRPPSNNSPPTRLMRRAGAAIVPDSAGTAAPLERLVVWCLLAPAALFAIANWAFDWWRDRTGQALGGEPAAVAAAELATLRVFTLLRRIEVLVGLLEFGAIVWLVYLTVRPFWSAASPAMDAGWRRTAARGLLIVAVGLGLGGLAARSADAADLCALLVAAALSAAGLQVLCRAPRSEFTWLVPPLLLGWAARVVAALALQVYALQTTGRPVLFDDESSYDYAAKLALHYDFDPNVGEGFLPTVFQHLPGHFLSFVTGIYAAVAPTPLAGRLVDALIGTCAIGLGAMIARRLFGRAEARVTAYLLACMPSLVIWDGGVLKEALASALLMALIWGTLCWLEQPRWLHVALIATILHVFASVRQYVPFAALGLLAPVGWQVARGWRQRASARRVPLLTLGGAAFLAGVLWLLSTPAFQPQVLLVKQTNMRLLPPPYELLGAEASGAERVPTLGGPVVLVAGDEAGATTPGMLLAVQPPGTLAGGWQVGWAALTNGAMKRVTPDDVRPLMSVSYTDALRYLGQGLLLGIGDALLAPLVGDTHTSRVPAVLLYLDLGWWLAALTFAGLGVRRGIHTAPLTWGILALVSLVVLVLAVVPGNPGNLIRQRASMGAQPLLLLAGPGILAAWHWVKALAARGGPAAGAARRPA